MSHLKVPALILVSLIVVALGIVVGVNIQGYRLGLNASPAEQPADAHTIEHLNDRAADKLIQPGWVHIVSEVIADTDTPTSDNPGAGVVIPLNYTANDWFHLNDNNVVIESVSLTLTPEGRVIQAEIVRNGQGWNLTLNEAAGPVEPYSITLDYGFRQEVIAAESGGLTVTQEMTTLEDKSVTLIVIQSQFDNSTQIASFAQPIVGSEIRAYFDPDSGRLLRKDSVLTMADGTERVGQSIRFKVMEWAESPPTGIVEYLQEGIGN